eukprot:131453_1
MGTHLSIDDASKMLQSIFDGEELKDFKVQIGFTNSKTNDCEEEGESSDDSRSQETFDDEVLTEMLENDSDDLVFSICYETTFIKHKFRYSLKVQNAWKEMELLMLRLKFLEDENIATKLLMKSFQDELTLLKNEKEKRERVPDGSTLLNRTDLTQ